MATSWALAPLQDENDVAHGHRVKFDASAGGTGSTHGKGLGGLRAGAGLKTPGKGLSSGRKALGNITNTAGKGSNDGSNQPGKTHGDGKPAQRVLGDLTNATPGRQQSAFAEPAAAPQPAVTAAQPAAQLHAPHGIEHRAGKGWQQLEAERLQAEAAAAKARARDAILPWATRWLPPQDLSLQQLAQRSAAARQQEVVPPCPPSPPLPASPTRAGDVDMDMYTAADVCAMAALLPDVDESLLLKGMGSND